MNIYKGMRDSLYASCKAFLADQSITGNVHNFDAFVASQKLPDGNLIGLYGFTLDTTGELVTVKVNVGLSIVDDPSMNQLDEACGELLRWFGPATTHHLYDPISKTVVGKMTIGDEISLSPVYRAQQRPLKLLHITVRASKAVFQ